MGSLVRIPLSDVTPTLEILERLGTTEEDLGEIRRHPEFAKRVAELFVTRRKTFEMAIGEDEALAKLAVQEINETKPLVDIINKAKTLSAARLALSKIPTYEAYHIARLSTNLAIVETAIRLTDNNSLWLLICSCAIIGEKRAMAEREWERRHGSLPQVTRTK